jgi:protein gp37
VLTVWRRTGLAVKKTSADGKTTCAFTGKIQLLPDQLADPLPDHIPKMYFVNSMSDLFHKDVPDEFIEAVFEVMEQPHWHRITPSTPHRLAVCAKRIVFIKRWP